MIHPRAAVAAVASPVCGGLRRFAAASANPLNSLMRRFDSAGSAAVAAVGCKSLVFLGAAVCGGARAVPPIPPRWLRPA